MNQNKSKPETKERQIHFDYDDMRALLKNEKTSHIVPFTKNPNEVPAWIEEFGFTAFTPPDKISGRGSHPVHGPAENHYSLRYGKPQDVLWVKEKFSEDSKEFYPFDKLTFEADNSIFDFELDPETRTIKIGKETYPFKWKPSAMMPKRFSRFKLVITSVKVKRLKDLTTEEKMKTGNSKEISFSDPHPMEASDPETGYFSPKTTYQGFEGYWINKYLKDNEDPEKVLDQNPFVWVIDFTVEKVFAPRAC